MPDERLTRIAQARVAFQARLKEGVPFDAAYAELRAVEHPLRELLKEEAKAAFQISANTYALPRVDCRSRFYQGQIDNLTRDVTEDAAAPDVLKLAIIQNDFYPVHARLLIGSHWFAGSVIAMEDGGIELCPTDTPGPHYHVSFDAIDLAQFRLDLTHFVPSADGAEAEPNETEAEPGKVH